MTSRQRDVDSPKLLDFIELPSFTRRWAQLGLDDEGDLSSLQMEILAQPSRGKVVQGTQSLRKLRFAPPHWNRGKSGATRVLYVYFEEFRVVLLCVVYGKTEVGNISAAVKQRVNRLIDKVREELRRQEQGREQ